MLMVLWVYNRLDLVEIIFVYLYLWFSYLAGLIFIIRKIAGATVSLPVAMMKAYLFW